MSLSPPPTSRALHHHALCSNPNSPYLRGLTLRCPMRPPPSVLASHAALHLTQVVSVSTKARGARTQRRGVPLRDPSRYRVISQAASSFLVLSRLPTLTLRGAAVPAVSERHLALSGEIYPLLPLVPVLALPSSRRPSKAHQHAVHFSMLSNLSLPYLRARPSRK